MYGKVNDRMNDNLDKLSKEIYQLIDKNDF